MWLPGKAFFPLTWFFNELFYKGLPILLASYQREPERPLSCLSPRIHRRGSSVQAYQQGRVSFLLDESRPLSYEHSHFANIVTSAWLNKESNVIVNAKTWILWEDASFWMFAWYNATWCMWWVWVLDLPKRRYVLIHSVEGRLYSNSLCFRWFLYFDRVNTLGSMGRSRK